MKTRRTLLLAGLRQLILTAIATTAFTLTPQLIAGNGQFKDANGNWNTDASWVSDIQAEGAGFTADFSLFTATRAVALASTPETIGVISGTGGAGFALTSTGGTLTMDNSGSQAQIINPATVTTTHTVPLRLTAGGLKFTTGTGATTLNGGISGSDTAAAGTHVLELTNNSGNLLTVSNITDGNGAGLVGVLINGGTTSLTGTSDFSGDLTIRSGGIRATNATVGTGTIYLGDAGTTGAITAGVAPQGSGTYTNNIETGALPLGATGVVAIAPNAMGNNIFSGTVTINRALTVTPSFGGSISLTGDISGTGALLVGSNNSFNTTTISGSNSAHSGGVRAGSPGSLLNIGSANALGTGTFTIGIGTAVQQTNLQIDNNSAGAFTLAHNNAQIWSNFTFVGTRDLNMGTGGVTLSTLSAIVTVLNNKLTVGGVISGASKIVGSAGAGTLELTGANSYTGATYVGATMEVTSLADGDAVSNIGQSPLAAGNLILNRGTLKYGGATVATDRLFTIGNGGATIDSSGGGALEFENIGVNISTDTVTIVGNSSGVSFTATPQSTISVGFTGNLAVGQSITGTGIAGGTTITQILDGSRIVISANTTGVASGGNYLFGALDRTLTLTGSNAGSNTIAGILADSASKKLGVTKSGTGSWALSGTNTFTGATTITAGTLVLSTAGTNNISTSATINVQSGGNLDVTGVAGGFTLAAGQTLAGTGSVVGSLTVADSSTLSPGNSPGTLNTGNETWLDGGNYNWQIYDATGLAGTGYDTIAVTGTLDLTNLSGVSPFKINLWSLSGIAPDANGNAINFNNALSQSWTLVSTTVGITGFLESDFTINVGAANGTSGFTNALNGTFSVGVTGNDLILSYAAVPEPATWALLAFSLTTVVVLRRRKS